MSIFDTIFGTNQPAPAPAPVQQTAAPAPNEPGNIPPGTDPNAAAPQGVPVTPPVTNQEPKGPLDDFAELWQNKPNKDVKTPVAPVALNAEDVKKAMAKTDFSSAINAETMTAIAAGGEDAQTAFATAMNQVAQQVMVQSTLVNNKLAEKAIKEALARQEATIPDLVRAQQVTNHNTETNPIFNNPAVKPVVEATQQRLLQQFPTASNAEITKMTQEFIVAMGQEFAPKADTTNNPDGEPDWEKFLTP